MSAKAHKKSRTSHRECCCWSGKDAPFSVRGSVQIPAYQPGVPLRHQQLQNDPDHLLGAGGGQKQRGHVNLAMTLAASNKRVVLVDCDMRKSAVSRYHAHSPQPGWPEQA